MQACGYTSLLVVLPLLFLFVNGSLLHGQIFAEDIRISCALEQTVLPEDAKIQSAARIGNLMLVVWGSSRKVTEDSVANVLYWQMVRDTTKLGTPQPLTDNRFDPFGFIQVLSLDDRFLVVWNDRRDAEVQTWFVQLDMAGSVGVPELWWQEHPLANGGVSKIRQIDGWLVIWSDTTTGRITGRRFAHDGTTNGEVIRLDTGFVAHVISDVVEPGQALIDWGDLRPLLIRSDGTIARVEGRAADKFTGVLYINGDGSALKLQNGILSEYTSVLDTIPALELVVSIPTKIDEWTTIEGSEYLGRDQTGRLRIYFNAYALTDATQCTSGFCPSVLGGLFTMNDLGSMQFGDPIQVDQEIVSWKYYRDAILSVLDYSTDQQRLCNGLYLSHQTALIEKGIYRPGQFDTTVREATHLTMLLGDTSAVWYVNAPTISLLQATHCFHSDEIQVARLLSGSESKVALSLDSLSLTLEAPAARSIVPVPHQYPAIARFGNEFLVPAVTHGFDSMAVTYRWSGQGGDSAHPPPFESISFPDRLPIDLQTHMALYNLGGQPMLHLFRSQEFLGSDGDRFYRSYHSLHLYTESGWREIANVEPAHRSRFYGVLSAARDPDDGTILVATGWLPNLNFGQVADSITVAAYSPDGEMTWRADSLKTKSLGFHIVPLEEELFVGIGFDKRLYQFDGNNLLERGEPLPLISSLYEPYYEGSFLWSYSSGNVYHMEQRNSHGELLKEHLLSMPTGMKDCRLCVNPLDSGTVLLCTRQVTNSPELNGVYMFGFDRGLKLTDTLQRINAIPSIVGRPSGTFRNDTLYIVWEDYRSGNAEIYANAIVPKTSDTSLSVASERTKTENQILSIVPNPARDLVRIHLTEIAAGGSRIGVWNLLGSLVLEKDISSSSREIVVNVETLLEGAYVLRIEKGEWFESRVLLIIR